MESSPAALEVHISQLLDSYIHAFNTGDFSGAASYYNEPAAFISAEGVTVRSGRQDIVTQLSSTVEKLREDGFDHSEWAAPKKTIVLDDTADKGLVLSSCACRRLRKDRSVCEEFTATYSLRKANGEGQGWLIAAIHLHPLETQLK